MANVKVASVNFKPITYKKKYSKFDLEKKQIPIGKNVGDLTGELGIMRIGDFNLNGKTYVLTGFATNTIELNFDGENFAGMRCDISEKQ